MPPRLRGRSYSSPRYFLPLPLFSSSRMHLSSSSYVPLFFSILFLFSFTCSSYSPFMSFSFFFLLRLLHVNRFLHCYILHFLHLLQTTLLFCTYPQTVLYCYYALSTLAADYIVIMQLTQIVKNKWRNPKMQHLFLQLFFYFVL